MPYEIETPRLYLNRFDWRDLDAIFDIIHVEQFQQASLGCELPQTKYQLARWLQMPEPKTDRRYALRHREDNRLIGMISIHSNQLSYWLAANYWQQGLMTEALSQVLFTWFEKQPQSNLLAEVLIENKASMRLLESMGYLYQGEKIARFHIKKAPANRGF